MILIYGYRDGSCAACENIKQLFGSHNLEYRFISVLKGNHCFKTVPQTFFSNGDYCGDYNEWLKRLNVKPRVK